MATTSLNIAQRLGGPTPTMFCATFLGWRLRAAHSQAGVASAFTISFVLLCSHGKRSRRALLKSCRIGSIPAFQFSKARRSLPAITRPDAVQQATWFIHRCSSNRGINWPPSSAGGRVQLDSRGNLCPSSPAVKSNCLSIFLHLSKAPMFCFAHAKAKFGHKCCLIEL